MQRLSQLIPETDKVLQLEAPELAGVLLELLLSDSRKEGHWFNRGNFTLKNENGPVLSGYLPKHHEQLLLLVSEAWGWLAANGLIAISPDVHHHNSNYFITRLGRKIGTAQGLAQYRKALELPRERLHFSIAERCWAQFARGEFDTAVFQAYKSVEITIREAAKLPQSAIGVPLAREAFHPESGPLRDKNADSAERQALSDLMAGALGSYKNPHSHRNVELTPEEAAEMVILASHLLRIIDSRRSDK